MAPQNQSNTDSLENLFISFARFVLARLKAWEAAGEIPLFTYFPVSSRNGSREQTTFEKRYKYGMLLQRYYFSSAQQSSVTDRCVNSLWNAGILQYPQSQFTEEDIKTMKVTSQPPSTIKRELSRELLYPIFDLLNSYETYDLTDEQITKRFTYFKGLWLSPSIRWEITFPLLNFTSSLQQSSQIGTRLSLAPLLQEERHTIWNELTFPVPMRSGSLEAENVAKMGFKLVGFRQQIKSNTQNLLGYEKISDELNHILLAFRLTKAGDIGVPIFFEKSDVCSTYLSSVWQFTPPSGLLLHQNFRHYPSPWWNIYHLDEKDFPMVKTLFHALQTLHAQQLQRQSKPYGDLSVAFRHFNQAYARTLHEDLVIDLTIALESSLLAELRDELSFRLSLRGAALLADTEPRWEPSKSQALLKAMYDIRS